MATLEFPPISEWQVLVAAALAEDVGSGDVTSNLLVPRGRTGSARLEAREALRLAGLPVAEEVFRRCGATLKARCADTSACAAGEVVATVQGPARSILLAERTALNFLQHLSGVATLTGRFCDAVAGTRARIVDTRKTTPGWRSLEKYAVRCGGGVNHRRGLFDAILIKDNHIAIVGSLGRAVRCALERRPPGLPVIAEVESLEALDEALAAGAEGVLVDNQPPERLALFVERVAGRVPVEASGGVTLENAARLARTGVDRISVGALTHSAPAADLALEWQTG
ncbi:MAG: carboxylating nicotinate-nucleotide diphosphorylase [Myxococcota bacterium]